MIIQYYIFVQSQLLKTPSHYTLSQIPPSYPSINAVAARHSSPIINTKPFNNGISLITTSHWSVTSVPLPPLQPASPIKTRTVQKSGGGERTGYADSPETLWSHSPPPICSNSNFVGFQQYPPTPLHLSFLEIFQKSAGIVNGQVTLLKRMSQQPFSVALVKNCVH